MTDREKWMEFLTSQGIEFSVKAPHGVHERERFLCLRGEKGALSSWVYLILTFHEDGSFDRFEASDYF